jgi:hypothetical protein
VLRSISFPGWLEPFSRIWVNSAPLISRLSRPKLASPVWMRPAGCLLPRDSDKESDAAELVTAFLATGGEDFAAAFGGHASAEADVADALDFGGLEGAFHVHFSLSWWILPTLHRVMAGFPAEFRMARAAYLTRKRRFINCHFSELSQPGLSVLAPVLRDF